MSSSITQRLEKQHPALLHEVVSDLKVLTHQELRTRIRQWINVLFKLHQATGDQEEKSLLRSSLTRQEQYAFLKEHLLDHEIIRVLITVNPDDSLLDSYLRKNAHIAPDNIYAGQWRVVSALLAKEEETLTPARICQLVLGAVDHIEQHIEPYQHNITHEKQQQRRDGKYRVSVGCELFADEVVKTRRKKKYQQAAELYLMAHTTLSQSGYISSYKSIELLYAAAKSYRTQGNLDKAEALYLNIIDQCYGRREKQAIESSDYISNDPIYHQWHLQLLREDRKQSGYYIVFADLNYIQILLEKIQQTDHTPPSMLQGIWLEICDAYDTLSDNPLLPYELFVLRQITYARYMMLVNEPEQATTELMKIDDSKAPGVLVDAKYILLDEKELTYIQQPKKKAKIVSMLGYEF